MPAQAMSISSALSPQVIGGLGDDIVGSVVFEISSAAGGFSSIPSINVPPSSSTGTATTPTNCQYINLSTGAISAAGTAITANGVYAVYAPGCEPMDFHAVAEAIFFVFLF